MSFFAVHSVVEAKNLLAMDYNGKSDPYIVFSLTQDQHKQKYKTKVISESLNPVWDESFTFVAGTSQVRALLCLSSCCHPLGDRLGTHPMFFCLLQTLLGRVYDSDKLNAGKTHTPS